MSAPKFTVESLKAQIYSVPIPKDWREGQFVFNRVEELYKDIARKVQFIDDVDCFYLNGEIDRFLTHVVARLNSEL
jgi:hypothetical protein